MAQQSEGRLWIRLVLKHRVERDALVACERDDPQAALREALPKLDLSQPLWLPRHEQDWAQYALTRFKPEHFLEPVHFDYMEISYIYGENEAHTARSRNPMEDA